MKKKIVKNLILDVDGVMTTGHFFYDKNGKCLKVFGPDDNDALSIISKFVNIVFVTGDRKGFAISKRRIENDMKFKIFLVSTLKRVEWIKKRFNLSETIYMGDGIFDYMVMKQVFYAIAPNNADLNCKKYANFITKRNGGERAVAEACLHILKKFFKIKSIEKINLQGKLSGEWNA
jgi:3-deoxy-D-manno-octulosonate 8-phosphate phosphatase (KDO 8-P phosphatase)|tara:strand:+ start:1573 stop:2100 length:528 start_codon:yes stop_codon:yes gene_type:complete